MPRSANSAVPAQLHALNLHSALPPRPSTHVLAGKNFEQVAYGMKPRLPLLFHTTATMILQKQADSRSTDCESRSRFAPTKKRRMACEKATWPFLNKRYWFRCPFFGPASASITFLPGRSHQVTRKEHRCCRVKDKRRSFRYEPSSKVCPHEHYDQPPRVDNQG